MKSDALGALSDATIPPAAHSERWSVRPSQAQAISYVPLVVDLDGTLIANDLLHDAAITLLFRKPAAFARSISALKDGKSAFKDRVAGHIDVEAEGLPYRREVIALIEEAKASGRPVYLATASHERFAQRVADHLGLFDGVLATSGAVNLAGERKAQALIDAFGVGGFDYIGNSRTDLPVWQVSRRAYAIALPAGVRRRLAATAPDHEVLPAEAAGPKTWLRALRVHQYAKNALIFLPMIAGHALDISTLAKTVLAFISFSLAASAIYLINDLADLADDRTHPTKRFRPLASGALPVPHAAAAAPLLILLSLGLSLFLPLPFLLVLAGYLAMTTAYSFWLKRKLLIDVVLLALLYSCRVVAGSAATGIVLSNWLIGFSLFVFTSLALIKRYTELVVRLDADLPDSRNRGYRKHDLPVIAALAAATGCNSVTVLGLYISSPQVTPLYRQPQLLWLLCPLMLFLVGRALLVAHRRRMHDDPVVWALKDKVCRIGAIIAVADVVCATLL